MFAGLRVVLTALLALALVVPAASLGAASGASAEVDAYLEVVPDAGGGTSGERVPIESVAPRADTEHCLERGQPGAGIAAAGYLSGEGPAAGGGLGPFLIAAIVLVSLALVAAALARRRRGAAVTTLCLGLLLVPAVAMAVASVQAEPGVELGVVAGRQGETTLSEAEVQRMRLGGADSLRVALEWELVQPERGAPFDFADFDRVMTWASEGRLPRLGVLPILFASPSWVEGIESSNQPPTASADLKAWQRFVRAAVARYGPDGSFWAEHEAELAAGEMRLNPISDWQVWNEPNLSPFWTEDDPDPREYAELLSLTDEAIKAEDREARTVLAGMLQRSDAPLPMTEFLGEMYRVKGISESFDVLAPQPFVFVDDSRSLERALDDVRSVADENGDGDKPIFVTEVGVATAGPKTDLTTNQAGQAATLREYFRLLGEEAGRYGIQAVYWFQWRDADVSPARDPDTDRWQTYAGLFTYGGAPKESWQAFCAAAGGSYGSGSLP